MNDLPAIRAYRPEDSDALRALHNRVFLPAWSEELWNWRFLQGSPEETSLAGAFSAEGTCLALHGGRRHRLLVDGVESVGMSHSDVAVEPRLRAGIGGARYAVRVGRLFIDEYCKDSCAFIWGFPQPQLRRLLIKFLKVGVLCDLVFLVNELREELDSPAAIEVREVGRCGDETDGLWTSCSAQWTAAVVRDRYYLNWRFAEHPSTGYRLLEARDARTDDLRGLCILREGGWSEGILSLMEWLVPKDDRDAERALLAHSVRLSRRHQKRGLVAWFPACSLEFHRLQIDHGFLAHPTPYQEVFVSWTPGIDRDWLHQNWFQTMGDIDFF